MKPETKEWLRQWGRNLRSLRIYFFGVNGGVLGFYALLFLKHRYGHSLYVGMFRFFGITSARLIIGLFVLAVGLAATVFKQRNQMWYGLVEWVFGVCAGFAIAFTMSPAKAFSTQWVTLIGCAYVIARGFNNMIEAGAKQDALRKAAPS